MNDRLGQALTDISMNGRMHQLANFGAITRQIGNSVLITGLQNINASDQPDFQLTDAFNGPFKRIATNDGRHPGRRSGKDQVSRRKSHVT